MFFARNTVETAKAICSQGFKDEQAQLVLPNGQRSPGVFLSRRTSNPLNTVAGPIIQTLRATLTPLTPKFNVSEPLRVLARVDETQHTLKEY